MEEEESYEPQVLDYRTVQSWVRNANLSLHSSLGFELPVELDLPKGSDRTLYWGPNGTAIPVGALFYPCCGHDLSHAVANFGSVCESLHFADAYVSQGTRVNARRKQTHVPHVGTVVLMEAEEVERVVNGTVVHFHSSDGLVALAQRVQNLSVFYYRGDSYGEGGSNQRWLEPVLFHYVLSRLMDGGLIVTDGSNCGYHDEVRGVVASWNHICASLSDPRAVSLDYCSRRFNRICDLKHPNGSLAVWQVLAASSSPH